MTNDSVVHNDIVFEKENVQEQLSIYSTGEDGRHSHLKSYKINNDVPSPWPCVCGRGVPFLFVEISPTMVFCPAWRTDF
jgi:hypothetical protein